MMKLQELLSYLFGAGGIVLFLLSWLRYKKKDAVSILRIQADTTKTNAEAQEIRAKSDVLITDGALRIVERLSKDLDEAREEIEKLIVIVADLKTLHEKHKDEYIREAEELHKKLREAKELIEVKKRHCIEIKSRIMQLQELLLLRQAVGNKGLTALELDEFVRKLAEIITFKEDYEKRAEARGNG